MLAVMTALFSGPGAEHRTRHFLAALEGAPFELRSESLLVLAVSFLSSSRKRGVKLNQAAAEILVQVCFHP